MKHRPAQKKDVHSHQPAPPATGTLTFGETSPDMARAKMLEREEAGDNISDARRRRPRFGRCGRDREPTHQHELRDGPPVTGGRYASGFAMTTDAPRCMSKRVQGAHIL